MGVAHLYRHLIESFPHLTDILNILQKNEHIFLYMDFNGIIHPCIGRVISRYEKSENLDRKKMEDEMFEEVKKLTLDIMEKINPEFLFIAIDGVAPRAKMEQQRKRRYKSVIENSKRRRIFDTNSISPGTPFMKKLTNYMKLFIENELKNRCKILFSSAEVPGEGEHKIINFIKQYGKSTDVTHVIYGLDADLIMLSMTTGMDNIFLLREKQLFEYNKEETNNEHYILLPISKLKQYYWDKYNCEEYITKQQFINDLIFLCFFAGNDFLEHLKVIAINKNGIELMLTKYMEQMAITKKPLLNNDYTINQKFLLGMFKEIYDNEEVYIEKNNKMKEDNIIKYYEKGWKERFYNYYFGHSNQMIRYKVAENYSQILKWTTMYYFEGNKNWSMYYRYQCPPCFSDLYEFWMKNNFSDIKIVKDNPYTMNQQLMIIMPPSSAFLISRKYNHLMRGKLRQFYAHGRISFDSVDKTARYQWTPILPVVDDEVIKRFVRD